MVTVVLHGGLGNQMFEYATGLSLARRHQVPLVLDTTYIRDRFPRKDFAYRTFRLDEFTIDAGLTPLSRLSRALPVPGFWLGLDLLSIGARRLLGMTRLVREKKEHSFDPGVYSLGDRLVVWGYWQSVKYFEDIGDEVRSAFTLKSSLTGPAMAIADRIKAPNAVSVHVRRGDFVTSASALALHGATDLEYYRRAVEYVAARVSDPHFFVFSDDTAWCRENLHIPFPVEYPGEDSAGPDGAWHLSLMSYARCNIIANSTFSWWSAWLNSHPEKIVIAPKAWYAATSRHHDEDIVPGDWIRL